MSSRWGGTCKASQRGKTWWQEWLGATVALWVARPLDEVVLASAHLSISARAHYQERQLREGISAKSALRRGIAGLCQCVSDCLGHRQSCQPRGEAAHCILLQPTLPRTLPSEVNLSQVVSAPRESHSAPGCQNTPVLLRPQPSLGPSIHCGYQQA